MSLLLALHFKCFFLISLFQSTHLFCFILRFSYRQTLKMNPTKVIYDGRRLMFNLMGFAKVANIHEIRYRFLETRVANLLGFSFIAINNKIRPIYCNKSNKIQ